MGDTVIRVNGLGKKYRIGTTREKSDGLRHALEAGVRQFGQRLRGRFVPTPTEEDFWALKDVSFEVKRGESVGVIGRNGAGKSTLLKVLSRITEPTVGEVGLKGRVASLLEVGTGFHQELTGRENIFLNGAILGMERKEIARKFDEIVAFSGVEKFLDTPVKRYSSGMYVRLAFAVAAHLEPEILIVDEVLAVGDEEFQRRCLGKMQDVVSTGRTIIFVSHNMSAMRKFCHTLVLMSGGQKIAQGPTAEIIDKYLDMTMQQNLNAAWSCKNRDMDFKVIGFTANIETGDLTLNFNLKGKIERSGVGIGYSISTPSGIEVASYPPRKTRLFLPSTDSGYGVQFRCAGLATILTGGDYVVKLWFSDPGVEYFGVFENIGRFSIEPPDPYGSGKGLKSGEDGLIVVPASISFV